MRRQYIAYGLMFGLVAASAASATQSGKMKLECKTAVAGKNDTKPFNVSIVRVSPVSDGFSLDATAYLGDRGIKAFNCLFDEDRKLKSVAAVSGDGE